MWQLKKSLTKTELKYTDVPCTRFVKNAITTF